MRHTLWLCLAALVLAGCATSEPARRTAATTPATPSVTPTPTPTSSSTTTTTSAARATTRRPPKPSPTTPRPTKTTAKPAPRPVGLKGDTRNALAFARLSNPGDVTIEGSVPSSRAWSTSKVLVMAAFLDTVAGGDPDRASAEQRRLITRALTESHMESTLEIRDQIPGSPGAAITAVLRSIGDTTTVAPDSSQGSMQWTVRQQVKFMAALHGGRVVSPKASAYLLRTMQPIPSHRWGLGTIGADSFKGGWLRSDTETRQMGIVDGYAVAIITAGVGPAVPQSDGDSAHVRQMDWLADVLTRRLAVESTRR